MFKAIFFGSCDQTLDLIPNTSKNLWYFLEETTESFLKQKTTINGTKRVWQKHDVHKM